MASVIFRLVLFVSMLWGAGRNSKSCRETACSQNPIVRGGPSIAAFFCTWCVLERSLGNPVVVVEALCARSLHKEGVNSLQGILHRECVTFAGALPRRVRIEIVQVF